MNSFLDPSTSSLKICGITVESEAETLVELGVDALGINFWPKSKRYLSPEKAEQLLTNCKNRIVRVGVFVNEPAETPLRLLESGLIDIAQFHGDENPDYCIPFAEAGLPFIKAIGVKNKSSLDNITDYGASAILLDTPAPGVYGGTGETFDWAHARDFISKHPDIPVLLAGGITPDNAAAAISEVKPCALDIASGAELSPGIKDFTKVAALLSCTQATRNS